MFRNLVERANQVTLDVVRQRFDGRDVNGVNFLLQLLVQGKANQLVDHGQKGREGFTRTRGRTQQEVLLVHDGWNGQFLRRREIREFVLEPLAHRGAQSLKQCLRL